MAKGREKQEKNLQPVRTYEEASKRGRAGGIKSGQAKKKKKLISQIYAQFLADKHEITDKKGKKVKISSEDLLSKVVSKILFRGDGASVSMVKEIREATEGSKVALTNQDGSDLLSKGITVRYE